MQTGSSGCQYHWLTIVLLTTLVFWFNQMNLAMSNGNLKQTPNNVKGSKKIIRRALLSTRCRTSINTNFRIAIDNTITVTVTAADDAVAVAVAVAVVAATTIAKSKILTNDLCDYRHCCYGCCRPLAFYWSGTLHNSCCSTRWHFWPSSMHNINSANYNIADDCLSCCEMATVFNNYHSITIQSQRDICMR